MAGASDVERWFATTRPPGEAAMRRVRATILAAHPSMRERVQYGITFSSIQSGDFGAFVRYSEPGVNLRLHRGSRLRGDYPHLEGGVVRRMRIADAAEARARASEITAMVREWCALGAAARAPSPGRSNARRGSRADRRGRSRRAPSSGDADPS